MKTGTTLQDLATELNKQLQTKRDFIADTRQLRLASLASAKQLPTSTLYLEGHKDFTVRELMHDQIAARLQIPKAYYDRMRKEAPDALDYNVNFWFQQKPDKRMIRTIDGQARAFLSDKYRPLDNYDLTEVILPVIARLGCRIESCALTETRLYIKAVNERLTQEVVKDDLVQAGIVISNSEVGCGSVSIEPMVFRLACLNGMIVNDLAMRKYHVGRGNSGDDELSVTQFFKDATRQADDKAFWMKVKDVVEASLTEALFTQIVGRMRRAKGVAIEDDPIKAVEVLSQKNNLTQDEQSGILKFLVQGGDLSLYGMVNAITRASQDVPDYDRATELERLGGAILETVEA